MSDPQIEMVPVSSSMITAIGYDPETETMRVQFRNGAVYELAQVPAAEYDVLSSSASIGKTYNEFFKDRYSTSKL